MDRGDTERCWNLFLAHYTKLTRYVRRLGNTEHDPADVVHEVAVRLLNGVSAPACEETFGAWCNAVARHVVFQQRRALRYRRALHGEINLRDAQDVWRSETLSTSRLAVLRQLADVDPLSRDLLLRRYVLEQSSDEIARDTELSSAAVRMRLMRLRSLLTDSLGDAEDPGQAPTKKRRRLRRAAG